MITVRNEFVPVPAFEHIAGDSLGTWTQRETTVEMIQAVYMATNIKRRDRLAWLMAWRDLAGANDDDLEKMVDIQEWCAEQLNEHMPMPAYCHVKLQDNEWQVLPYLDEEVPRMSTDDWDEVDQNQHGFDHVYVVNDHGNVTCWEWRQDKVEYVSIWSMV